jgi:uncharacterized membrane protein
MIYRFDEYIKEEFDFFDDVVMFPIKYKKKIQKIIDWPVVKYIERKTKNLTEEEKILKIAKIANTLDKWFSPFNSVVGAAVFSGISAVNAMMHIKTQPVGMIEIYAMLTAIAAYGSLNKEYRLLAKKNYQKIKKVFIDNANKIGNDNDPYGEEQWFDEDNTIARADAIRYNKRFKHLEDMPWFGLHSKKDVMP